MYIHYPTVTDRGSRDRGILFDGSPTLIKRRYQAGSKSPGVVNPKSFQMRSTSPKVNTKRWRYTRHRRGDKSEEDSAMKTTLSYRLDGL